MNTLVTLTVGELVAIVMGGMLIASLVSSLVINWVNERHFREELDRQMRLRDGWAGMVKEARGALQQSGGSRP